MMKRNMVLLAAAMLALILFAGCSPSMKDVRRGEERNDLNALFNIYASQYDNEKVHSAAREAFVRKGQTAAELLLTRLASAFPVDRRAASSLLGELRVAEAVEPLMAVLTSDEDAGVRAEAAMALGEIGNPKALGVLALYSRIDDNPVVRWYAGEATLKLHALGYKHHRKN